MNIAIDYDGVYTADPALFTAVAKLFRERGHNVYCVSARGEESKAGMEAENVHGLIGPIILTDHKWKKAICDRFQIPINVWIDDACTEIVPTQDDAVKACKAAMELLVLFVSQSLKYDSIATLSMIRELATVIEAAERRQP